MTEQVDLHDLFARAADFKIWRQEILDLHERFGPADFYHSVIELSLEHLGQWDFRLNKEKKRRGEVALCVRNSNGTLLLHRKSFYPDNTFRIPTGGIHKDESAIEALTRELFEETGFIAESFRFMAFLLYEFRHHQSAVPFVSYIFDVRVADAEPRKQDEKEDISGYMWITPSELEDVITNLQSMQGDRWMEWGTLRAVPHEIIFTALEKN